MSISNALDPLNATDIKRLFFEKINVTQVVLNSHVEMYRCRCGQIKTQSVEDETNDKLVEHVLSDHMEWLSGPASFVNDSEKVSVGNGSCPSTQSTKRESYLTWNDYFMSVAFLSAMRSKDPSTQVGACIVNPEKKIVGIGYNGFPNGCDDDDLPWARQTSRGDILATKYPYVCHAEMNAILNKNSADVQGCTIYVALFPCNECAKLIIQSGIRHIVYYSDKYHNDWKFVASRTLFDMAKVTYTQHTLEKRHLLIDFHSV